MQPMRGLGECLASWPPLRERLQERGDSAFDSIDDFALIGLGFGGYNGPDGLAVVQPYMRRARGSESPALVVRGGLRRVIDTAKPPEPGLFQVYQEEFEGVWADSRAVS